MNIDDLISKLEERQQHGPNDLHELVYQLALVVKTNMSEVKVIEVDAGSPSGPEWDYEPNTEGPGAVTADSGAADSEERTLVRCEPGPHGPRIVLEFDGEERSISVARASRVRDGLTVAIAQGLVEVKRQVEERKS